MGLEGREGLEGLVRQVGSACGQASPRLWKATGEHQHQFALGVGPRER